MNEADKIKLKQEQAKYRKTLTKGSRKFEESLYQYLMETAKESYEVYKNTPELQEHNIYTIIDYREQNKNKSKLYKVDSDLYVSYETAYTHRTPLMSINVYYKDESNGEMGLIFHRWVRFVHYIEIIQRLAETQESIQGESQKEIQDISEVTYYAIQNMVWG